ncbi:sodium:solute symporter [Geobacillus sp. GHH01]|uniref:sodium:solute symporter family transporter n=1 Tax=Geobacillus sp. GHH01 TaxID=1233873 RepID=UPI001F2BEADF|nr:sodium:solute symporter [Geobacillus sp. GHH01]
MLGVRFGPNSRYISGFIMAVYDMMVAVTTVIAIGVLFSSLFDWNNFISMIVGGVVVILYTLLGGMWAVTLTDVIQFWIMTIGLIVLLLPLGIYKAGGISEVASKLDPQFLSLTNIGGKTIFAFFLLYFFGMMIGQDIWQRAFTAKNEKVLRNGTVLAGVYCIIYGITMAVIGMIANILIPDLEDSQQALPQLILNILPSGLIGLLIAAVASAIMSTASGTIMATSTIIVNDFILPKNNKMSSEKEKIRLTRIVTLLVGVVIIVISLWLQDVVVALDIAYALLSGSIFLPVIAALFWKSVTSKVTMISMLVSAIVVILDLIVEGVSSLNAIIYGLISSIITMYIGTKMHSQRKWKNHENNINL